MSSVVKIIKRADRGTASTFQSTHDSSAVSHGAVSVVSTVKGWIAESRERQRTAVEASRAFMRGHEKMHVLTQTLAAKMIVGALILTACLCGLNTHAAGQSIVRESVNYSLLNNSGVEDHFVVVENLRVHYIATGSGRTVVMIHGNAGNVEDFEFGTVKLLAPEYRVVAIDRPGHGSSDRPTGKGATLEYQAELLHRTLLSLAISQPILVGHSWGASLALAYSLKYPSEVSGMVLLAPAAYPDKGENKLLRSIINTPFIGDVSLLLGKPLVARLMLRQALDQAFHPQAVPNNYFKVASSLWLGKKQLKAYIEDEWALNDSLRRMSQRYSDIRIPVVIVTGDEDKIVSPKENAYRLQTVISGSQLIELKNAGHEIPQTHPESICSALMLISQKVVSPDSVAEVYDRSN
jgi:pimeloyl-ACP methyl ester carboxylesterase